MRLVLLRHGEASFDSPSDALRPLTEKGQLEVRTSLDQYFALQARHSMSAPAIHLCVSPLLRARQTCEVVSAAITAERASSLQEGLDWLLPSTDLAKCIAGIESLKIDNDLQLWLVAHNPLLSKLWSFLTEGDTYSLQLMTGQIVELECDWLGAGCANVMYQS